MNGKLGASIAREAKTCGELVASLRERLRAHGHVADFIVSCWQQPEPAISVLIELEGDVLAAAAAIGAGVVRGNLLCMNVRKHGGLACDQPHAGVTCLGMCR